MDIVPIFRQQVSFFITYIAAVTVILLLTDTIGAVNNGNMLADEQGERKDLEKKYNDLQYLQIYLCW